MPRNTGEPPAVDVCDIRYRNGRIERAIDPAKRRWTLDDPKYPPAYAYDIVHWQRTG
jgi:hypothetical protein